MTIIESSLLAEEVRIWNTPLYGAFLLWCFTDSYEKNHPNADAPSALLHFIALPILTSPALKDSVSDRRKNLQSYVQGFEDKKRSDILLSLHDKINTKKNNTLASIDAAIYSGLLSWDLESGKLYSHNLQKKPIRGSSLRSSLIQDSHKARVLGKWLSEHDIPTIASYLRVVL